VGARAFRKDRNVTRGGKSVFVRDLLGAQGNVRMCRQTREMRGTKEQQAPVDPRDKCRGPALNGASLSQGRKGGGPGGNMGIFNKEPFEKWRKSGMRNLTGRSVPSDIGNLAQKIL